MQKYTVFPIWRCNQSTVGASRRAFPQVAQPRGLSNLSCKASALLSDSSRWDEMKAMPASTFDIPLLSHCFIDHRQTSSCSSGKRRCKNAPFVMWSSRWRWKRGRKTQILFFPHAVASIVCGGSPLSSFSLLEGPMTLSSFFILIERRGIRA